jgi:hypothetical protein
VGANAAVLFAVWTCIPTDDRNRKRYARGLEKYRTYSVFRVSERMTVRHHRREGIAELLRAWEPMAASGIRVTTMNGHETAGFQWQVANHGIRIECSPTPPHGTPRHTPVTRRLEPD